MDTSLETTTWHFKQWGLWGWLETAAKGIGIAAGLGSASLATLAVGTSVSVVDWILVGVLGLLTLLGVAILFMRIQQREILAAGFALASLLAHAILLLAVLSSPFTQVPVIVFGVSFVLGELLKQRFLVTTGYTESGNSTARILMMSRTAMAVYAGVIVLGIL